MSFSLRMTLANSKRKKIAYIIVYTSIDNGGGIHDVFSDKELAEKELKKLEESGQTKELDYKIEEWKVK